MENTITATDVRYRFPELVKRVQQGESFVALARVAEALAVLEQLVPTTRG